MAVRIVTVRGEKLYLETAKYYNDTLAVFLTAEGQKVSLAGPYATVSVNLPKSTDLPPNCFYGKHWSENEGILEELVQQGAIEVATDIPPASSGFIPVTNAYKLIKEGE